MANLKVLSFSVSLVESDTMTCFIPFCISCGKIPLFHPAARLLLRHEAIDGLMTT